jgi:sugar phosphate isomerase/epimerase
VELALTYRFTGIELNLERFQEQVAAKGMTAASRYLQSAPLKLSTAELPIKLSGSDSEFSADLAKLESLATSAQELQCPVLYVTLESGSSNLVYHENFDLHRNRIAEIAGRLVPFELKLGLAFSAVASDRGGRPHPFVDSAEGILAMLRVVGAANLCLILDLWHWTVGKGTLEQIRQLGADRIGDLRLADLPKDYLRETVMHEDRFLPGTTEVVDCVGALKLLRTLDYRGPVTPTPNRKQLGAKSREQGVEKTSNQLDVLFQQSGLSHLVSRRPTLDLVGSAEA